MKIIVILIIILLQNASLAGMLITEKEIQRNVKSTQENIKNLKQQFSEIKQSKQNLSNEKKYLTIRFISGIGILTLMGITNCIKSIRKDNVSEEFCHLHLLNWLGLFVSHLILFTRQDDNFNLHMRQLNQKKLEIFSAIRSQSLSLGKQKCELKKIKTNSLM